MFGELRRSMLQGGACDASCLADKLTAAGAEAGAVQQGPMSQTQGNWTVVINSDGSKSLSGHS